MTPAGDVRCERHPTQLADWLCSRCGKPWCGECVSTTRTLHTRHELVQCPACRDRCVPSPRKARLDHRARREAIEGHSIAWVMGDALARPCRGYGLFVWIALGFLYAIPAFSKLMLEGIAVGGMVRLLPIPYFLRIVRHAAKGAPGLPEPGDVLDWYGELVYPAIRFVGGCWLVVLPAGLYALIRPGEDPAAVAGDPIFWMLVAVGLFYLPAVIVTTAMTQSVVTALNPMLAVRLVSRIGSDYPVMLATTWILAAGWVFPAFVLPIPISLAAPWIEIYLILVAMGIFGNVLKRRSRELGFEV